jgi:hypothetical protein
MLISKVYYIFEQVCTMPSYVMDMVVKKIETLIGAARV